MPFDGPAVNIDQPYGLRFGYKIPYGQHQPVFTNDNTVSDPFGPQHPGCHCIFGNLCSNRND